MAEPDRMATDPLLADAAQRASAFLTGLNERAVTPGTDAVARLGQLERLMPEHPSPAAEVLRELDEFGSPAATASAGGRFFGYVVGGSLPAALAANWLASAWDQNAAAAGAAPGAAAFEAVALAWLLDLLGLPADAAGAFVTGATMGNFCALAAARHRVLQRAGWNADADGLFGAPPVSVVVGDEAHPTLLKALGLLGFGRQRVVRVPVDAQGRMRAECLPRLAGPAIVCLQAGNVNSGGFDPFAALCAQAHADGAWVHVDGAFGLWAQASPRHRHLTEGVALADSWATDAHKWLNVPYDSGLAFVRDGSALRAAMSVSAAYLPQGAQRAPSDVTPELSRRARGVDVWAALRSLGRSGVAELIGRCCAHARRFADGLREAGFEVLNDVALNQVLVAFGDDGATRRVIAAVQADGTCWCGPTVWQGRTAMRISISSWATTADDVQRSLRAVLRAAGR